MSPAIVSPPRWFLAGFTDSPLPGQRVAVSKSPFRVGRLPDLAFRVQDATVSKVHAELILDSSGLLVRDLGSTNGTFVNGHRIDESLLHSGDLLQFANSVFRVTSESEEASIQNTLAQPSEDWPHALLQFDRLMSEQAVVPHFQPIVRIDDHEVLGYEVLARGKLKGLETPYAMFSTAEQLGQEAELSRIMRLLGAVDSRHLPAGSEIFLNTHPRELTEDGLIVSLRELRELLPRQRLTLEIHEAAITDLAAMRKLRAELNVLDIRLAYDDFGAGQARLLELTEVPPDYLKFDMRLIRDLHQSNPQRRQVLSSLIKMVRDIGVAALAEGIECQEEAQACLEVGFTLAQGYYFGRPAPLN